MPKSDLRGDFGAKPTDGSGAAVKAHIFRFRSRRKREHKFYRLFVMLEFPIRRDDIPVGYGGGTCCQREILRSLSDWSISPGSLTGSLIGPLVGGT